MSLPGALQKLSPAQWTFIGLSRLSLFCAAGFPRLEHLVGSQHILAFTGVAGPALFEAV